MALEVVVEHLNHVGIVAEVYREIGAAECLDAQDNDPVCWSGALVVRSALARLHADTTSFAVSGDYSAGEGDVDAQTIAVTYRYAREYREDVKQWMNCFSPM